MKLKGYTDEQIYVIAKDDTDITMVKARTGAEIERTEGSWWDHFTAFLSGETPVRETLGTMGLDPIQADNYYKMLKNGSMLLFVEQDEVGHSIKGNDAAIHLNGAGTDPNLGANLQQPEYQIENPAGGIFPSKRM